MTEAYQRVVLPKVGALNAVQRMPRVISLCLSVGLFIVTSAIASGPLLPAPHTEQKANEKTAPL